jgi:hypothetical protein
MTNLVISGLHHDTARGRSIAFVTENDPEKKLGFVVPFGCNLDQLTNEVTKAVRDLSAELASATVATP